MNKFSKPRGLPETAQIMEGTNKDWLGQFMTNTAKKIEKVIDKAMDVVDQPK